MGRDRWEGQETGITKVHEETFWGDEYIYYLDYDDDFTGICICQNLFN